MAPHNDQRAEIYALATEVLGETASAERWMLEPAIGLNQQVPADLIGTPEGAELVETYLIQIEHGVYV